MSVGIAGYRIGNGQSSGIRRLHSLPDLLPAHLISFEFQEPRSAFTSWRARKRDPKTFSLTAHDQELVLRHANLVTKLHLRGGPTASVPTLIVRVCSTARRPSPAQ